VLSGGLEIKMKGVVLGVSRVADGNMSLNWGDRAEVLKNRQFFLERLGLKLENCVTMSLVHGVKIVRVGKGDCGKMLELDGLVTDAIGVGLFMVTADCFPVVVFDPVKKVLAMVHAGKVGVGRKIITRLIEMLNKSGSKSGDLQVWIGPGIRKESYRWWETEKVKEKNDPDWKPFLETINGAIQIDVLGYIRKQLADSGVKDQNIEDCGIDTMVDINFFSHYRSGQTGEKEGRFATVAMLKL